MTTEHRILVVDDDPIARDAIGRLLAEAGHTCALLPGDASALERLEAAESGREGETPFAVMILDMSIHFGGLELIREVTKRRFGVVPLAVTGYGTIEAAVKAIRAGAIDYLTKPLVDDELRVAVERALRQHALVAENRRLRRRLRERDGLDGIVGNDRRMREIFETIEAVAPTKTTVLMRGESGTGKSMIARAIHRRSPRAGHPFVEVSCGSIPETLLESELFGHVKGAFTGAHGDKPGRFRAAHGGTIFLDEINSASPGMQLKLLRVLQERCFEPVGTSEPVSIDVRIILASNQPLEDLVAGGHFRQDLYYRVNVITIDLPPMRDRIADIPLLAEQFLIQKSSEIDRHLTGFSDDALACLRAYAWPGNVRELENVVERAVVLSTSTRIDVDDLPRHVVENRPPQGGGGEIESGSWRAIPLREALEAPERGIILAALEANGWNRQATAEALQINRTTLYKKIKRYGLAG